MTTWTLVIETTTGAAERKHTEAYVVAHVEGTREDALLELERRAREYTPEHPWTQKRRRLLRIGDGFLLIIDGAWRSFSTRFSVAELLEDSGAPAPDAVSETVATEAEPEAEPEPAPEPEPATEPAPVPPPPAPDAIDRTERYADGVPVRPAWLGRTDLS